MGLTVCVDRKCLDGSCQTPGRGGTPRDPKYEMLAYKKQRPSRGDSKSNDPSLPHATELLNGASAPTEAEEREVIEKAKADLFDGIESGRLSQYLKKISLNSPKASRQKDAKGSKSDPLKAYAQRVPNMPQANAGITQPLQEPSPGRSRARSEYSPDRSSPPREKMARILVGQHRYSPDGRDSESPERAPKSPLMAAPMRALCPELIVPPGSACVLAVRYFPEEQVLVDLEEFHILTINGAPVLKVEVLPVLSQQSGGSQSPAVVLKSLQPRRTSGGSVFASCHIALKDDDAGVKQQNVYIYDEDDELYAHFVKEENEMRKRYVLTSGHHHLHLLFEGDFEEHVMNITNESGERVAFTEPRVMDFDPTKFYKLHAVANVDVGLVLCGLLMINQLELRA